MKLVSTFATSWLFMAAGAQATSILAPGDFIIAVSSNAIAPASSYPAGEAPPKAIDGVSPLVGTNKYLNFGKEGTGFIATPAAPVAMQSFTIGTAGDADGRDPSRYEIWGTNSAIASTDNSTGLGGENWVLLSVGSLALPTARNTTSSVVNISNTTAYDSYKVVFPAIRNSGAADSMQIGEFTGYTLPDAGGVSVFSASNPILAIDTLVSRSNFPAAESPANAIDGTAGAKYLNFAGAGSGFIVTPSAGATIVGSLSITSADDSILQARSPTSYELYGTNSAIVSYSNTTGTFEAWTLISSGAVPLPIADLTEGDPIMFDNSTAYTSYKVLFPTLANPAAALQVGEVKLFAIPEPGVALLSAVAMLGLGLRRRR